MTTTLGISALSHDAAIAVLRDQEIVFAGQAERYSRTKNDRLLNHAIVNEAISTVESVDRVVFYERPWIKKSRQILAQQVSDSLQQHPRSYLSQFPSLRNRKIQNVSHHHSHAAGAYYTSPFRDAAVVIVDAIGEWETLSVWRGLGRELRRIHTVRFPHSLGLLYSAFTQRVGLKPNEEEYIFMGMAAYGEPKYRNVIVQDLISRGGHDFRLNRNLHRGLSDWQPDITNDVDIAASAQAVIEEILTELFDWVSSAVPSGNLVYSGGVALNCVFNGKLAESGRFDNIWIPPNPGDAGSALGAALASVGDFVNWRGPYLGSNIERAVDLDQMVTALADGKIVGLANGRAEYGPRALGNRSLLADPRRSDTKARVNDIKRRQQFRPFAPVVMAERASDYFKLPLDSAPYMQYTVPCRDPGAFAAICHVDGTSRVQTVDANQNPLLYELLTRFERSTGCPMLLNTSLNVRGQPLVNTWEDAVEFGRRYGIQVF
jgi:carbamoyltransferase